MIKTINSLPSHIPIYQGPIDLRSKNPIVAKAYRSWCDQRSRTSGRTKAITYHGKSVDYSSREFISWFIYELDKTGIALKDAVCGRKNHAGNYCFSNIQLETKTSNAREVHARWATRFIPRKPISMVCLHCDSVIKEFKDTKTAAEFLDISLQRTLRLLRGKRLNIYHPAYKLLYS